MVLIILCSYGSYLYVVNRTLDIEEAGGTKQNSYLSEYFNNGIIDSIISVYMIGALGNFTTDRFRVGDSKYYAMFMFLTATFMVSVVFMNMLIAIMGETFGQVLEGAE